MYLNKADQILMNEVSKIDRKIKALKAEIIRQELVKKELSDRIQNKPYNQI